MKKPMIYLLMFFKLFAFGSLVQAQDSGSYKIIVNAANPVSSLSKDQVSKLFLKKVTKWDHGKSALPVDLIDTPVRQKFSEEIHGKKVSAIKAYWQQKIFSGREVPPPEKASDEEVLSYVQANPDAIGYISGSAAVDNAKIKVLNITK